MSAGNWRQLISVSSCFQDCWLQSATRHHIHDALHHEGIRVEASADLLMPTARQGTWLLPILYNFLLFIFRALNWRMIERRGPNGSPYLDFGRSYFLIYSKSKVGQLTYRANFSSQNSKTSPFSLRLSKSPMLEARDQTPTGWGCLTTELSKL